MSKPLLSAFIFTYNHGDTIARCIDSHLNQKTSYGYKIKIYDDCSTDGTTDICRQYAAAYPDKIELVVQPENTFLKPFEETQSYSAFREIDTKYFSIIDGDDYWCDENKVQEMVGFLETHADYQGVASDTYIEDVFSGRRVSYLHDQCMLGEIQNPVVFSAEAPFFYTSSRMFRVADYAALGVLPNDYLVYYYHLSKGPIYFIDRPTGVYSSGFYNTYANLPARFLRDNIAMQAFRMMRLFGYAQDGFCTRFLLVKKICDRRSGGFRVKVLCALKKMMGIKVAWNVWFAIFFAWRYGFRAASINYVYRDLKKMRDLANRKSRETAAKNRIDELRGRAVMKLREYKLAKALLLRGWLPTWCVRRLREAMARKRMKMRELNQKRHSIEKFMREGHQSERRSR